MDNISFDNAFDEFVEKRIHDALVNKSQSKQIALLQDLENELLALLTSEQDRDKLKDLFFKILTEQNHISYKAGLSDSTLLALKLSLKNVEKKEYLD